MAVLALSNLILSTRRLVNETDATNSHFTDSEITDYLNQAVTFLGTQMEWPEQIDTATAVPNQALYQLPADFIELVDVYFNALNPVHLAILERADLGQISPAWQTDPASTPRIAYRYNRNTIGLYPVPDANQTDYTIQIDYIYLPASLVLTTDVPNLHTAFQMALPFYAAFLCESKLGNDKKAEADLSNFERHRKVVMSKVQKYSDDLLRFRWGWAYPERNT
jgi:hypothetical protein